MIMETLSAFAALLFVLGLIALLAWAVKRAGLMPGQPKVGKGQKEIEILESRLIDARNRLLVVRWRGKDYLLGSSPNGLSLLGDSKHPFQSLVDTNEPERSPERHDA